MTLSIEQLKFAREIGATHWDCEICQYRKDGYIFHAGFWEGGILASCYQKYDDIIEIDFTQLDYYYADKAVDIEATSVPDGYYHDDESGKLKPLKPAVESAHDRLQSAVKAYRNEVGLECAYDPVLVEAENLLKPSIPAPEYDPADVAFKKPRSKYHREIKPGVWVDVYDVISAWEITNPAQQHLTKKALQAGDRGHKSYVQDMRDIIASAERAIEMFNENESTAGVKE